MIYPVSVMRPVFCCFLIDPGIARFSLYEKNDLPKTVRIIPLGIIEYRERGFKMFRYPCAKDCPKRSAECHTTCRDYLMAKERDKQEQILKKQNFDVADFLRDHQTRIEKHGKRKQSA